MNKFTFVRGAIPCNDAGFPSENVSVFRESVRKLPSVYDPVTRNSSFFVKCENVSPPVKCSENPSSLFTSLKDILVHDIEPISGTSSSDNASIVSFVQNTASVIVPAEKDNEEEILHSYELLARFGVMIEGYLDNKLTTPKVNVHKLPDELKRFKMHHLYKPNCFFLPLLSTSSFKRCRDILVFKSSKVIFKDLCSCVCGETEVSVTCHNFDGSSEHFDQCPECKALYANLPFHIPSGSKQVRITSASKQSNGNIVVQWCVRDVFTSFQAMTSSRLPVKYVVVPITNQNKHHVHPMRRQVDNTIVIAPYKNRWRFAYVHTTHGKLASVSYEGVEGRHECDVEDILTISAERHKTHAKTNIQKNKRKINDVSKHDNYLLVQISRSAYAVGNEFQVCSHRKDMRGQGELLELVPP